MVKIEEETGNMTCKLIGWQLQKYVLFRPYDCRRRFQSGKIISLSFNLLIEIKTWTVWVCLLVSFSLCCVIFCARMALDMPAGSDTLWALPTPSAFLHVTWLSWWCIDCIWSILLWATDKHILLHVKDDEIFVWCLVFMFVKINCLNINGNLCKTSLFIC